MFASTRGTVHMQKSRGTSLCRGSCGVLGRDLCSVYRPCVGMCRDPVTIPSFWADSWVGPEADCCPSPAQSAVLEDHNGNAQDLETLIEEHVAGVILSEHERDPFNPVE